MTIPIAAATMRTKVTQPKYLSKGEFTCLPISLVSVVMRNDEQDQRRCQQTVDHR
jgi:hypothetical protein